MIENVRNQTKLMPAIVDGLDLRAFSPQPTFVNPQSGFADVKGRTLLREAKLCLRVVQREATEDMQVITRQRCRKQFHALFE